MIEEILSFIVLCWMAFMVVGSCIIMTVGVWQMLKWIYRGEI